jgi:bifunctional non-homologous end joining protein LigD
VIPEGGYGAGQVIVWDYGTYVPEGDGSRGGKDRRAAEARVRRGLGEGRLSFSLWGRKLKGSWSLVRMRRGENNWLLVKRDDDLADPSRDILAEDRSVVSGLSIEDMRTVH